MSEEMVVLRRFSDSITAETLRGRLAVAGIDVYVRGTSIEAAFGLGGAPTSSGMRVEIARGDVEAALAVIAEDDRLREVAGDWVCNRCDEENDATFEFCWKCQKERGPNDTKQIPTAPQTNPITAPESNVAKPIQRDSVDTANPYQPVLLESVAVDAVSLTSDAIAIHDETIDNALRDLFRLACVSVLIIPVPLALYAVYRTLVLPTELKQHPRVNARIRRYFLFNGFIGAIVVSFWAVILVNLIT